LTSASRLAALLAAALCACAAPRPSAPGGWQQPSWSQQIALREGWLRTRHGMVLEMMRRHGVSMWIVANEEFHDDPLTALVAPARPYAGNRDFFVFADAGEKGLQKFAVMGYAEEAVASFFESPEDPKKQKDALAELFARLQPKTIALSIGPVGGGLQETTSPTVAPPPGGEAPKPVLGPALGARGVTRSLTRDNYLFLADALGPEAEKRFIPAAPLIEEYLDTRLPEEKAPYTALVRLTEALVREALSSEVITPGQTRVGDLRRFLYDALTSAGVGTWFQPDVRVQRKGGAGSLSRGFLAVAKEAVVIERGDLLHIDFGVSLLGLHTDWQKMAYVLKEGETAVPAGLKAALKNTNVLQDAMVAESRPGRTGAEVYDAVMAAVKAKGIEAQVYSHPLGNQGHALGAAIDFRSAQRKAEPKALRKGSYIAIELNTKTKVPEWDGQEVFAMEEDPAWLGDDGWHFFVPRQEEYYLIK
jgi:hypothetical protein